MSIDERLTSIIACPDCRAALAVQVGVQGEELACTGCDLVYPVRDDIPVLLVDEARRAGDTATGPA